TRDEQDAYAVDSHQKAAAAASAGKFNDEILPVTIPQKKGDPIVFNRDESVRGDTTAEVLRNLKPAFKKDGSVTAGNAPPVNDGAAAMVVMAEDTMQARNVEPMARIVAQATSGLAPKMLLMTPVEATRKVLKKAGWSIDEVDLIELNEAFAVQAVAVMAELGVDPAKVNVNGGAVALGHPIGASGARILTTLIYALRDRGLKRGIATLCLGGGNGVALAIEMQ
ncbi:MAG: acetyl-CoA C-acyltransferase, partial [Vicinamibacterales bacterium]